MSLLIGAISFEPGFVVVTEDNDQRTRHPVADVLRALDIPTGLTHEQVASISAVTNLLVILIRTLIERGVLDESFADSLGLSMSLDGIIEAVEAMGGSYHEPGLEDADA